MDLLLKETLNGGDLVKTPKDVAVIFGFQNVPYLSMFGGNVEENTPLERKAGQQYFDYWGNDIFAPNEPNIQFNSETERVLNSVALNSAGRKAIQNAVENDLSVMSDYVDVEVDVQVTSDDRVEILIGMRKPNNLNAIQFIYIWDATIRELSVVVGSPGNPLPFDSGIFDDSFDFSFE